MFLYFGLLGIGVLLFFISTFLFISMYLEKEFTFSDTFKALSALVIGGVLLVITLPSLKYILFKEYDVVKGNCVIDISSSGRSSEASFEMKDSDEVFYFKNIPDLAAYGRAVPYYCAVTVTKDHEFEIGYKIYNAKSRKLILTSD